MIWLGQRTLPTRRHLPRRYSTVRAWTEHLAATLSGEDQCVQSMPDASPAKWHRAHTTWFFEQFVLTAFLPGYQVFDDDFAICSTPTTRPWARVIRGRTAGC